MNSRKNCVVLPAREYPYGTLEDNNKQQVGVGEELLALHSTSATNFRISRKREGERKRERQRERERDRQTDRQTDRQRATERERERERERESERSVCQKPNVIPIYFHEKTIYPFPHTIYTKRYSVT